MEKIFLKAIKIIKKTSKLYYNQEFEDFAQGYKYKDDDVTDKDIATQNALTKELSKLIEGCGFIAEEQLDNSSGKKYVWIIDPIDGTANYKYGFPIYGTQVALREDDKIIFSCIYFPHLNELYYSYNNKTYLNGKVVTTTSNKKSRLIGLKYSIFTSSHFDSQATIKSFKPKKIRMIGCSSYEFAAVASGKLDAYIYSVYTPWDIEPGMFMAKNSGAVIYQNKEKNIVMVCANQDIKKELVSLMKL